MIGVFVYLIARGGSMAQRAGAQQQQADQQFQQLARLADPKAKGVITDTEFTQLKAKALA